MQGDNLQFLKTCYRNADPLIKDRVKGKVKLIYIDPPFATRADFAARDGEDSYTDRVDRAEFIETLRERIIFLREILSDNGSLYLHLDLRMSHFGKVILDEIFGRDKFLSEIIWKRSAAHSDNKLFGNLHDTILMYQKNDSYVFNPQFQDYDPIYVKQRYKHRDPDGRLYMDDNLTATGLKGGGYDYSWKGVRKVWRCPKETMVRYERQNRLHYSSKGVPRVKRYLDEMQGLSVPDIWVDIFPVNSQAKEALSYPTQKPEALLERIILASSNPGDLVMDVFAGSGTTAAVAEKLGRRWIVCDFGKHAIYTTQKRMLKIGESKALGSANGEKRKNEKYGEAPKPFCVVSTGAYDFSRIMRLRENRDAYVDFVLGLFQISRDENDLSGKYRLTHIFGEKDADPVEVYPVWEDEYLKNIRIDLDTYISRLEREVKKEHLGKLRELQDEGIETIIKVVEIKSDEEQDEATPAKAEYAKTHFERVNRKLRGLNLADIDSQYRPDAKQYYAFDLLTPRQFAAWFAALKMGKPES